MQRFWTIITSAFLFSVFSNAHAQTCEHEVVGTSSPPSSGNPTIIDDITGTVISANFFNSGAINPPYFDGQEFVSICVSPANEIGDRTATITSDVGLDNNFQIKAYPEFIVGTKFGNIFETSFRFYNNTNLPPEDRWPVVATGTDNEGNPFEFANLEYVSIKKNVGLPTFTSTLPDIYVTLDIEESNVIGSERDIMLESWFHDTSRNAAIIGNNTATNQPIANTLNNIVGVGHQHYPSLDNTLLEMMVHIAPLSPHDVSQSKNNPGQNQLTEIYSGKDFDGDGIDDHFDVDSHLYLNSTNPNHPNPGIYSSGVDHNSDGIDDAVLLPVVIGEFAYSIWYGETFLAPIVIFSRETNRSLTNDFDPNTSDMDVSAEGEIKLPWHEFIDYTLYDIEQSLQTLDVDWAMGTNNPFPAMRSLAGAIGGVEFGVEPQTNNPADQSYQLQVNKYIIEVNNVRSGLINTQTEPPLPKATNDTVAPIAAISTPATEGVILSPGTIDFSGTASDSGDSGLDTAEIAIRRTGSNSQWYDFNGGFSDSPVRKKTNLSNTTTNSTNWNLAVTLPPGNYRLQVLAFDKARNNSGWVRRDFVITAPDTQSPGASIVAPSSANETIPSSSTLAGIANDTGGSGLDVVEVAIRRTGPNNHWYDFNGGFSDAPVRQETNLSNTTPNSTNWSLAVTLPPGNYRLQVLAFDKTRNNSGWVRRDFVVTAPDTQSPGASITAPSSAGETIPSSSTLAGIANDTGGSGLDVVEVAIRRTGPNSQWYDFNGGFSDAPVRQNTNLSNTTPNSTNWSLAVTLPTGNYRLQILAFDKARNNSGWVRRDFVVE